MSESFIMDFARCASFEFVFIFFLCTFNACLEKIGNLSKMERTKKIVFFLLKQAERILITFFAIVDETTHYFSKFVEIVMVEIEGSENLVLGNEEYKLCWEVISSIFCWAIMRAWMFNIFAYSGYEHPEEISMFFVFTMIFIIIPGIREGILRICLKNSEDFEEETQEESQDETQESDNEFEEETQEESQESDNDFEEEFQDEIQDEIQEYFQHDYSNLGKIKNEYNNYYEDSDHENYNYGLCRDDFCEFLKD